MGCGWLKWTSMEKILYEVHFLQSERRQAGNMRTVIEKTSSWVHIYQKKVAPNHTFSGRGHVFQIQKAEK